MAVVGETGDSGSGGAQVHNNLINAVHNAISFHPSPHAKADYGNILARLLARQAKAHAAAGQTHGAGYAQTPAGSAPRRFLPVMPDGTQTSGGLADPSEYPNIQGIPLGVVGGGFGGPGLAETPPPGMQPGQVIDTLTGGPGGTPTYVGQPPTTYPSSIFDPPGINTPPVLRAILKARSTGGPGGGIFDPYPPGNVPAGLSPLLQAILSAGRAGTGAIFGRGPVAS